MYIYVKRAQCIGGSDGLVSCMSMPREHKVYINICIN